MKKLFFLFFLIINMSLFAQFPAPSNLTYTLQYNNDQLFGVNCNGVDLPEYGYCSTFSWEPADTLATSANFVQYCLYMVDLENLNDTVILSTTTQSIIEIPFGLTGYVCVKAQYINPEGESEASNWVYNSDLPIYINETLNQQSYNLIRIKESNSFRVSNNDKITQIRIINMNGSIVKKIKSIPHVFYLNMNKGVYIAEIISKDKKTIYQKIVL